MVTTRVLLNPNLSESALRDAYRDALQASGHVRSVRDSAESPLRLEAETRGGAQLVIDLERLYADIVRLRPEDRKQRFEDQLAASLDAARAADGELPEPTRDQIIPMLKNTAWVASSPEQLAVAPFVSDIAIVFAFDRPRSLTYAREVDIAQLGVAPAELLSLSLHNIRTRLPADLGTQGDGRSFLFTAGGNVEASLVLLPEIWDQLERQLPGEILSCVLARDVCLVTSTGIPGGIASLEAARKRIETGMPAADMISRTLLVRRARTWEPFRN
jgi:hypothetical protein